MNVANISYLPPVYDRDGAIMGSILIKLTARPELPITLLILKDKIAR